MKLKTVLSRMELLRLQTLLLYSIVWILEVTTIVAKPSVVVTAPVNPAREGGMISIHCYVEGLEHGQVITVSRKLMDNPIEMLSYKDGIMSGVEDGVFIAQRQLSDGNHVSFLSITGVTIEDQGTYTCAVFYNNVVISEGSVDVTVEYFPSDEHPICQSATDLENIVEGAPLTLNCTSEKGNPHVSLEWKRTGENKLKETDSVTEDDGFNDLVISTLTFIPSVEDSGSVFLCTITSSTFYDQSTSCHVGPIKVISNQMGTTGITHPKTLPNIPQRTPNTVPNLNNNGKGNSQVDSTASGTKHICRNLCDSESATPLFF